MSSTGWFAAGVLLGLISGGYIAYDYRDAKAQTAAAEYKAQAAELKQQAAELEASAQAHVNEIIADYEQQKADIDKRYHELLERERVRVNSTAACPNKPCPACPAAAAERASAGGFPRAYLLSAGQRSELLEIARDCDVTASKFNSLLELYNGAAARQ